MLIEQRRRFAPSQGPGSSAAATGFPRCILAEGPWQGFSGKSVTTIENPSCALSLISSLMTEQAGQAKHLPDRLLSGRLRSEPHRLSTRNRTGRAPRHIRKCHTIVSRVTSIIPRLTRHSKDDSAEALRTSQSYDDQIFESTPCPAEIVHADGPDPDSIGGSREVCPQNLE